MQLCMQDGALRTAGSGAEVDPAAVDCPGLEPCSFTLRYAEIRELRSGKWFKCLEPLKSETSDSEPMLPG